MDSGEKRLNELGYKQELRREMVISILPPVHLIFLIYGFFFVHILQIKFPLLVGHLELLIWYGDYHHFDSEISFLSILIQTLFKTLAISFSTMTLFTGITPLYGSSLLYAGPASLVWGWVVVTFFTWFVGIAMAEICSSFPVCWHYFLSRRH